MSDLNAEDLLYLKEKVFKAAKAGNVTAILESLRNTDEEVNTEVLHHLSKQDEGSMSPLMIAAQEGHKDVVHLLLKDFGVAVDQTGTVEPECGENVTALWCASSGCLTSQEIFPLLLERGANINHMDLKEKKTSLFLACKEKNFAAVKCLVSQGADVNLPNWEGKTPLMMVCSGLSFWEHDECVKYLLDHKADPNRRDSTTRTALHEATIKGKQQTVTLLLNSGANLIKDSQGLTPPLCGILHGVSRTDTLQSFVQHRGVSRQDKVDALEAMGSTLCFSTNMSDGYQYLLEAMKERYRDLANILLKPAYSPVPALGNILESQTLEELQAKERNPYNLFMECLLILERLLGKVLPSRRFLYRPLCGELQNLGRCDEILPMWHFFMQKVQKYPQDLVECLFGALDSFDSMATEGKAPKFQEIEPLVNFAVNIWDKAEDELSEQMLYKDMLDAGLRICKICLNAESGADEKLQCEEAIKPLVSVLNKKALKCPDSLLNRAMVWFLEELNRCQENTDSFHENLIRLLVKSGTNVNPVNQWGKTPLTSLFSSAALWNIEVVGNVVDILLKGGAHVECYRPFDGFHPNIKARLKDHVSLPLPLQCIATSAIVKYKLPYQSSLPEALKRFVQLHEKSPYQVLRPSK